MLNFGGDFQPESLREPGNINRISKLPGTKSGQELPLLCGRYLDPQVTDKQPMLAGAFLPRYDLHVGHSIAKFPGVQCIVNLGLSITRLTVY